MSSNNAIRWCEEFQSQATAHVSQTQSRNQQKKEKNAMELPNLLFHETSQQQ